jgi:hypothetical protein
MKPREEQCCGTCAAFVRGKTAVITSPAPGQCRPGPPVVLSFPRQMPGGSVVMDCNGFYAPVTSDFWCLGWQDRETHPLFDGASKSAPQDTRVQPTIMPVPANALKPNGGG